MPTDWTSVKQTVRQGHSESGRNLAGSKITSSIFSFLNICACCKELTIQKTLTQRIELVRVIRFCFILFYWERRMLILYCYEPASRLEPLGPGNYISHVCSTCHVFSSSSDFTYLWDLAKLCFTVWSSTCQQQHQSINCYWLLLMLLIIDFDWMVSSGVKHAANRLYNVTQKGSAILCDNIPIRRGMKKQKGIFDSSLKLCVHLTTQKNG